MRNFNVTVNGQQYTVTVEELDGNATPAASPQPTVQPAQKQTPVTHAATAAQVGEGTPLTAPMPGAIVEIKVQVGDSVRQGQSVVILEAMKMENDIPAPCDGKVTSITVKSGDTVESNQVLATIAP